MRRRIKKETKRRRSCCSDADDEDDDDMICLMVSKSRLRLIHLKTTDALMLSVSLVSMQYWDMETLCGMDCM